ncbi:hypothetical protein QYE76_069908 [Lolium multiflorum]|uniref:Uncharacterized protein n=1 Tax=Lolium multiflorum TaxID=4521 RepID=A0AAD8SIC9_LOLMU|nr:hypothetical protein QYE76_069908 [Lolium multiflorum]
MDKEIANPIVEVGSKRDASIFGAVPIETTRRRRRRLGATDFNCLVTHAENIATPSPTSARRERPSFRAKHRRSACTPACSRVEITAGRMPPLKPKAPKGARATSGGRARCGRRSP